MSDDTRTYSRGVPDPQRHDSEFLDHVSQSRAGFKPFPNKLYVITTISNPRRFRTRYELYRQFEKHMEDSGVILYTVEMAFREREFEITSSTNPRHVQVVGTHELWHKENLVNIGISRLPADWKYVAWVDADVKFVREDWAQETLHMLQHHQVLQLWSQLQDVSPDYELLPSTYPNSWCFNWVNGKDPIPLPSQSAHLYPYPAAAKPGLKGWYGPPGLAWAARREAIDALGGLMDHCIVGSGDAYMASALIGRVQYHMRKDYHPEFIKQFMLWQERAERYVRRNIGYVPGLVLHYWHGKKANRQYIQRNDIMVKHQFNPVTDLKRDWQGLWQLVDHGDDRSIALRDDLMAYFRQRNEDSIDV
jgi:hypothetical protein